MTAFIIVILLILGILLVILEFLAPGITIAGIGGVVLTGGGVYLAYSNYGSIIGHITLASVLVFNIVLVVYILKSRVLSKLMLNTNVDGKVETDTDIINIGDTGVCITRLAPMGKVKVGDTVVEGQSLGGYIDEHSEVEVVKVFKYKIIVKLKDN